MKDLISISGLPFDRVSESMIDALAEIYPEGVRTGTIAGGEQRRSFCLVKMPCDDPRVGQILATMKAHGWFPRTNETLQRQPNEFRVVLRRRYSRADREHSEYLSFDATKYLPDLGWRTRDEGLIILPIKAVRRAAKSCADSFYTDRPGWTVVTDRVRLIVEESNLKHIIFRPTILVRGKGHPDDPAVPWDEHGDPLWEITSDYILPPLSPTVQIVAQDGSTFKGYEKQNLELREGLYDIPELHYLRSEIEKTEPFDLALSHEHLMKPPWHQMKVASQRMYQLFNEHKIKASWIPVRIDENSADQASN